MAKLPTVSTPLPRDLQQFIQRVRESLDSQGPDAVVTARELIASGLFQFGTSGGGSVVASTPTQVDAPRAPRSVTTSGGLATIVVSWDSVNYSGHAYAEVWAASRTTEQEEADPQENPTLDQAVLVGMTAGTSFSHAVGGAAERWYWVRFINRNGVAGPYNATDGTYGSTSVDPEYVLEVLTEAVTSSQLASDLLANINTTFRQTSAPTEKADGSALVAGDLWYNTTDGNKLYRYDGSSWVNTQDSGISQAIAAASGAQGTADGKVTTYYQSSAPSNASDTLVEGDLWVDTNDGNNLYRWDDDGGTNGTGAWIDIQDTGINAAIGAAATAQAAADGKITSYYQSSAPTNNNDELSEGDLWTDTNDGDATYRWDDDGGTNGTGEWVRIGLASFADVTSSITDQVGYCELSITSGGTTTKSVSTSNNTQTLCQAAQADSNKPSNYTYAWKNDGAIASEIKTVTTSVGSNTTTIQQQTQSINGLNGQYTVKIDTNGAVAGFGLANSGTSSGNITSEFIVNADRFAIMRGGSDTTAATVPFSVQATQTTINGETVAAGVYMDTALIKNGTITNAKIADLKADKITASLLNTVDFYGNTIAGSTIYLGGTVNYTTDSDGNNIGIASVSSPNATLDTNGATFSVGAFKIDNGSSTVYTPFQVIGGVVYLNTARIQDGTIDFAKISDSIESTNYDAVTNDGWKLSKDGTLDLNSATITAGVLQSEDGDFVINLTNGTITISA